MYFTGRFFGRSTFETLIHSLFLTDQNVMRSQEIQPEMETTVRGDKHLDEGTAAATGANSFSESEFKTIRVQPRVQHQTTVACARG